MISHLTSARDASHNSSFVCGSSTRESCRGFQRCGDLQGGSPQLLQGRQGGSIFFYNMHPDSRLHLCHMPSIQCIATFMSCTIAELTESRIGTDGGVRKWKHVFASDCGGFKPSHTVDGVACRTRTKGERCQFIFRQIAFHQCQSAPLSLKAWLRVRILPKTRLASRMLVGLLMSYGGMLPACQQHSQETSSTSSREAPALCDRSGLHGMLSIEPAGTAIFGEYPKLSEFTMA